MNSIRQETPTERKRDGPAARIQLQSEAARSFRDKILGLLSNLDAFQIAALKRELLLYGVCIIMFWAIGAASISGYVITALFFLVTVGHVGKKLILSIIDGIYDRVLLRRYASAFVFVAFFCLVLGRACYITTVLIDL